MKAVLTLLLSLALVPQVKSQKSDAILDSLNALLNVFMLDSIVVTPVEHPMKVVADTVVFNSEAYNVSEDATLEELLEKIPGMEVSRDGTVTLHGRTITQLFIGGKRYFGGDVATGLKNIPAEMISEVRTYERESDFARTTGIDDGQTEPVIDLRVKRRMLDQWRANLNGGGGTSSRYSVRLNANRISDDVQSSVIANRQNMPGKASLSNTSRSQVGSGGQGDATGTEVGLSMARNKDKLKLDADVHFKSTSKEVLSDGRSESLLATGSSFGTSDGSTLSGNYKVSGGCNIEWKPTDQWTVICKPRLSYENSNGSTLSKGSTYRTDPFSSEDILSSLVNSSDNLSHNLSSRVIAGLELQVTRRFAKKGRSLTMRVSSSFTDNGQDQFRDNETNYWKAGAETDRTKLTRHYLCNGSNSLYVVPNISYNEPLGKGYFIQIDEYLSCRSVSTDRDFYRFDDLFPEWKTSHGRTSLKELRASLPSGYQSSFDGSLSYEGRYDFLGTTNNFSMRRVGKTTNLLVGVTVRTHKSVLSYPVGVMKENIPNFTVDVSPKFVFGYKPSKSRHFRVEYRTFNNYPDLANMIPVVSGTDPLNVRTGNPALQPSITHKVKMSYNGSSYEKQSSITCNLDYEYVAKDFSNSSTYDDQTGIRTTLPMNIDGNWHINGSTVYNKMFRDNRFSICNHLGGQYNNSVSYLYNNALKESEVNTACRLMLKDKFDADFRNDALELKLSVQGEFTNETSYLRPDMNQRPYALSGGAEFIYNFPWKMRASTDFSVLGQRGYAYDELNRNYYVWNVQLSQTVLKGKGTIRLDAFDVLGSLQNMTRSFGAQSRNITLYNGVSRYVMLRFFYRFKV